MSSVTLGSPFTSQVLTPQYQDLVDLMTRAQNPNHVSLFVVPYGYFFTVLLGVPTYKWVRILITS